MRLTAAHERVPVAREQAVRACSGNSLDDCVRSAAYLYSTSMYLVSVRPCFKHKIRSTAVSGTRDPELRRSHRYYHKVILGSTGKSASATCHRCESKRRMFFLRVAGYIFMAVLNVNWGMVLVDALPHG